ncbi:MAG: hypothetical protein ACP5VE_01325 [Chthonomonadales bacterium]
MIVRRISVAVAAGLIIAAAHNAAAQYAPAPGLRPGMVQRPAPPRNYWKEFKNYADEAAAKYQAKIVVDPALFVSAKPGPASGDTIEAALNSLVAQVKNSAWRRVYLKAGASPSPDRLAAAVRALEMIEESGLVLENPASRRATSFLKGFPVPASFTEDLAAQQFATSPVYVIFSTTPSADAPKSLEERYMDLQRQQLEMMMQMTPDQLQAAMARGMQMWQSLDPATRTQMMGQMMRAGMQMFMNMPPEQRQQLMQDVFQSMQGAFPGGPPPGPPGPPR